MESVCSEIAQYYGELKTPFFLASLTIGVFLFTMKSFIVTTMKAGIYDDPDYHSQIAQENVIKAAKNRKGPYAPLRSLTLFLIVAVTLSFFCAFVQIAAGIIGGCVASSVALAVFGVNMISVGLAIWVVSRNLLEMIAFAEENRSS